MEEGATITLGRRTKPVRRQVQHRRSPRKPIAPVGNLPLQALSLELFSLPLCEIGVLYGKLWKLHASTFGRRRIGSKEFLLKHVDRPPIGHDVVKHRNQPMLVRGQPHELEASRRLFQVEGPTSDVSCGVLRPIAFFLLGNRREIDDRDLDRVARKNALPNLTVFFEKNRPQRCVACPKAAQGRRERVQVQRSPQPEYQRDVIGTAFRLELAEKPKSLLRVGDRRSVALAPTRDRSRASGLSARGALLLETLMEKPPLLRRQGGDTVREVTHGSTGDTETD